MLELRGIQVWLTCPPNYPETVVGEPHIATREERGTAESIILCRRQAVRPFYRHRSIISHFLIASPEL